MLRLDVVLRAMSLVDSAVVEEMIVADSIGVDAPPEAELEPEPSEEWEPTGHTTCGARAGPGVMGLHPGKALMVPLTGSSITAGCSGQVREKLTSSLSARYEHALMTPLLSVYRQLWTAAVCTSISQPLRKSPWKPKPVGSPFAKTNWPPAD